MGTTLRSSLAVTGTVAVATAAALTAPVFAQNQLPEGNGKQVVQTACTVCHELGRITNAGHTPDEWDTIVHEMVMMGAALRNDQIPVVSKYLAVYFPPKAKSNAPTISGSVQANFKEFKLPTRAFPHDPYAAADGSIWYSGQLGNVLGRVDLKTGQVKDYPLPSSSGPHGLMGDKDGNIWFTGNFAGYVGKLDPKTGQVTQYKTPTARDPHSLIFDQDGILWFTAQGANQVGRIDPKTGEVKMVQVPTRFESSSAPRACRSSASSAQTSSPASTPRR
jgi:virginiamycin B lyase